MDNLTKEQRSYNMSRIRSSGTKLEQEFFELLEKSNILFTKYPRIYGKPDCKAGDNIVIFVDSDFWHGWHFDKWRNRMPLTYWQSKIENNIKRDKKKFRQLRQKGYKVVRIWQHNLKNSTRVINKIKSMI